MATHIDERGDRVDTAATEKTVRTTTTEARQGYLGKPVLIVLVCGLLLALVAWAGAELFGESTDNDAATKTEQVTPMKPVDTGVSPSQQTETPPSGEAQQPAPTEQDPTPQTGSGG